jgi:hypothetical protein
MNKAHLAKSVGTLVRLEPPAGNAEGASFDDDWLIVDVTAEFVELENSRTRQRTRVALDGVYTFHDDANRTTASQRFGFLVLHAQVELRDAAIDVRPFPSPRQPVRERPALRSHAQRLPKPDGMPQGGYPCPVLSVRGAPGTANVRGRLLKSADVLVENSGGPCTLVAYATLVGAAPGLGQPSARWEYFARPVKGGYGLSVYSVATIEPPDSGALRVVKVRGEGLDMRERYEGNEHLWLEVQWEFYLEDAARLAKVLICKSRVSLNERRDGFVVEVRDSVALPVAKG